MSSRESFARTLSEIAEVVEKRHDNVKRTIEMLMVHGTVHPQSEDEPLTDKLGRPRITKTYRVNQRDSYVIVAQLSPEFTELARQRLAARLVDRWQELEKQVAQPKVPHLQPERSHRHRHGHPRRRLRRRAVVRGEGRLRCT
ncbi:Rha family transcriptional regulator [Halomonas sp. M4R1S46]|uniref:Rha family transcriptional regulator n=1 Tax=Halomonas sp. M4R1S46 TaxID=2982692 RepID=UPI00398E89D8